MTLNRIKAIVFAVCTLLLLASPMVLVAQSQGERSTAVFHVA